MEELGESLSSDDPAIGLRASLALRRLAERVEADHVAAAREKGWSWQQIGDALGVTRQSVHTKIQQGVVMTTEPVAPGMLHGWAIYLQASEEARRRGDRRAGTDHVLLALFEDPSIEAVLGVSLQQAREALDLLDREALAALGLRPDAETRLLPMRAVPKKPRIRDIAKKDRLRMTPAAKKVLEDAYKPKGHRKLQVTGPEVLAQILPLQPPDPAAVLLRALGVNTSEVLQELASAVAQPDQTAGPR
jgi:hypothetical protein